MAQLKGQARRKPAPGPSMRGVEGPEAATVIGADRSRSVTIPAWRAGGWRKGGDCPEWTGQAFAINNRIA